MNRKAPRARAVKALAIDPRGYSYAEARPLVRAALRARLSVLLRGHPGVGKSSLVADVAAELGLPLIDLRLAQREPAELAGVYFPDRERRTLTLLAPDWVRAACDAPAMVFLDEINAAVTRLHQAAAYQIVLERRVGPFRFHPETVVVAAGNLDDDGAIVAPMSSALANRFVHLVLREDVEAWLAWGAGAGVDEGVMAYIAHHGERALYARGEEDEAFPSPRSWEMASRMLRAADPSLRRRVVAACVGTTAAERFFAYRRVLERVNAAAIVQRGRAIDFTTEKGCEPSFIYAAVYAVAAWLLRGGEVSDRQLPHVVKFLRSPGLDIEYVALFLRQLAQDEALSQRLRGLASFRALEAEVAEVCAEASR